jgi:nucleoside-diphosphate-sugar epimerase
MNNERARKCGNRFSAETDMQQQPEQQSFLVAPGDRILITGAAGFIGSRVVQNLVDRGFKNLVCFVRPSSDLGLLDSIMRNRPDETRIEIVKGNLLSREDCEAACRGVKGIFHVAAGIGEKSFPDAYLNSVVATRNLLEASLNCAQLQRFVLVSSFTVYTNRQKRRLLDESCPVDQEPELRGEAYCFAKVRQEQIVAEYGEKHGVPYVIIRPGSVYGPRNAEFTGRVGIDTFGFFLHLGGSNTIPFTYVDNCADAVVLAGLIRGVDRDVFNVVDDDLPSSRTFLRQYKAGVRRFRSIYLPQPVSYALCYLWERYSRWSHGQLPPVFNRSRWHADWKRTRYSNQKLKVKLGWAPHVSTQEGFRRYFAACAQGKNNA